MSRKALRIGAVVALTGLSRATIYRLEKAGDFPKRFRLTARTVAWNAEAVEAWLAQREAAGPSL